MPAAGQPGFTNFGTIDPALLQQIMDLIGGFLPNLATGTTPGTTGGSLPTARTGTGTSQSPTGQSTGQFGFPTGQLPGGDAIGLLARLGFPLSPHLLSLQGTNPNAGLAPRPDFASALMQLAGLNIPAPSTLRELGPSGLQFTGGLFESLAGVPFSDVAFASARPFQGLRTAQQARTGRSAGNATTQR